VRQEGLAGGAPACGADGGTEVGGLWADAAAVSALNVSAQTTISAPARRRPTGCAHLPLIISRTLSAQPGGDPPVVGDAHSSATQLRHHACQEHRRPG
jgi:hypothetical protein